MPPGPDPKHLIDLTPQQRDELEAIARKQTAPHRRVQRAKMILEADDGTPNQRIADKLDVAENTVRLWRERFHEKGLPGLEDEDQEGRPPKFDDEGKVEARALACHGPDTVTQATDESEGKFDDEEDDEGEDEEEEDRGENEDDGGEGDGGEGLGLPQSRLSLQDITDALEERFDEAPSRTTVWAGLNEGGPEALAVPVVVVPLPGGVPGAGTAGAGPLRRSVEGGAVAGGGPGVVLGRETHQGHPAGPGNGAAGPGQAGTGGGPLPAGGDGDVPGGLAGGDGAGQRGLCRP